MALEYVVTKGVFGFDKDKNEKYVAKSVCSGRVSSSKMCGKVSHLCGVHRKVVDLFVSGLVDMSITRHTELETDIRMEVAVESPLPAEMVVKTMERRYRYRTLQYKSLV